MYLIEEFVTANGKSPFRDWLVKLSISAKARIQARIFRFELGNLGDHKSLGQGLYEARFSFGPGYRLYFAIADQKIILLLLGGSKRGQSRDIEKAKKYWCEWKEVTTHAKKKS